MAYSAQYIAKWFLTRNRADVMENIDGEISNMKLQKLLYYAQGTTLALTGEPLFDEEIEAWRHGPVVPSVYQTYKHFGGHGITFEDGFDGSRLDENHRTILEEVYQQFGQFSAWKLRNMTHEEDPWKNVKINQVISKESIRKYFQEHYVEEDEWSD